MPDPATITVPEAAELLGVSEPTAYRAVHSGDLPSIRVGRRILIPQAKLYRMLGLDEETDHGD